MDDRRELGHQQRMDDFADEPARTGDCAPREADPARPSVFVIGDALKSGKPITTDVILTGVLTFFVALGTITVLMRLVRKADVFMEAFTPGVIDRFSRRRTWYSAYGW